MAVCCETVVLNEITRKTLLKVIDQMVDEFFFKNDALIKLGWCSRYMTDSRTVNYPSSQKISKTSSVEFYWLNSYKNRFQKQETLTEVFICNCVNCKFLESKNSKK